MREEKVDFFDIFKRVEWACVTTNGIIYNGRAVMGAGIAGAVSAQWPSVEVTLAQKMAAGGNVPHLLGYFDDHLNLVKGPSLKQLWSFPTKHHFKDPSPLELVLNSARLLVEAVGDADIEIAIPRPGCGLGGLDWEDVRVDLKKILDDRFIVIHN
jgi:hypothetical protein